MRKFESLTFDEQLEWYLSKKPNFKECFLEKDLFEDNRTPVYYGALGGRAVGVSDQGKLGFKTRDLAIKEAELFQDHIREVQIEQGMI